MRPLLTAALLALVAVSPLLADGNRDNVPDSVRPIPPKGIEVPADVKAELQAGVEALGKDIEAARGDLKDARLDYLPDVQIYFNAVRYALTYGEFYDKGEFDSARDFLKKGSERLAELRKLKPDGRPSWLDTANDHALGYVSKIDGSVQPYGLHVPKDYNPAAARAYRLDTWFHGRGENLTEINFIRGAKGGPFAKPDIFVLELYGRYCNANKMAGEVDLFEALADVKRRYHIDEDRIVIRGFSMGGAATWHFAVHYPGLWCAAAPGAGFSETPDFLKVFQNEPQDAIPAYQKKLWHWYDCTDYALNLTNVPTIAYSGEKDRQKQAADVMAKAAEAEGVKFVHIIGPGAAHNYEDNAKKQVADQIDAIAARGLDRRPASIRFVTYTLRYNTSCWVRIDGMEREWERAQVDADLSPDRAGVTVTTKNVSALTLTFPEPQQVSLHIDDPKGTLVVLRANINPAGEVHFQRVNGKWQLGEPPAGLRKRHGLQGPIDDAFMDSFIFVRPTGKPLNEKVGAWAAGELDHAIQHWRLQFRGEARVKDDKDITDADAEGSNLILFGDPSSNAYLAKIAGKLPVKWSAQEIALGDRKFSAADHAPVFIYPNPVYIRRYVVVNSGFTFREYDYLNNARQVAKLPDWAIVDLNTPVTPKSPGKIEAAGFFGEKWEYLGESK
jgi:dienelactone hydrolase